MDGGRKGILVLYREAELTYQMLVRSLLTPGIWTERITMRAFDQLCSVQEPLVGRVGSTPFALCCWRLAQKSLLPEETSSISSPRGHTQLNSVLVLEYYCFLGSARLADHWGSRATLRIQ